MCTATLRCAAATKAPGGVPDFPQTEPRFGWDIPWKSTAWHVASFLRLSDFLAARGFALFLFALYAFAALLATYLALAGWLVFALADSRRVSPVLVGALRWYGLVFGQLLFTLVGGGDRAGTLLCSVEALSFALVTVAALARPFVTSTSVLGLLYAGLFAAVLYRNVQWVPFRRRGLNYARCAVYAAVLYSAVVLAVLGCGDGGDAHRRRMTRALWFGLGPAALAGAIACHCRLLYFSWYAAPQIRGAWTDDLGPFKRYAFTDARQVEIAARLAMLRPNEEGGIDQEAAALYDAIVREGLSQLPQDPAMILLHASFLIDVQGSYQSGYAALQVVKRQPVGFLERFAVFCLERERSFRTASSWQGDHAMSYIEGQRHRRILTRAHEEALVAIRSFWALLLHSTVDITKVSKGLRRIEKAVETAERAYRSVLWQRERRSAPLVRMYCKFLEEVKLDPWAAAHWYTEADRLDALNHGGYDASQWLSGSTAGAAGAAGGRAPGADAVTAGLGGEEQQREGQALLFVDAQGTIRAASREAHELLGYGNNELHGRNVNVIMPPPLSTRHSAYIRDYIRTGKSRIMGKHTTFVALTKQRRDSVFMGVLEPVSLPQDEARLWLLASGTVVAADERLCEWLGYRQAADVMGRHVGELVTAADKEAVHSVLKELIGSVLGVGQIAPARARRSSVSMDMSAVSSRRVIGCLGWWGCFLGVAGSSGPDSRYR
ncbi:hypothetical protein GPECTOR_102g51 [Gonium pectorale]|uniref:PAS domain-containing protein n=1 Tax=Gonium pectorale TaxID=33097 RepID=A0A150FZU6_GONPE|nr:hypothetical protein GPECTOR_102g51 [Gonium pectorale]|eukprot:KXZ43098.1 hypothetical protein GPECTOR_102g51 [Gonium pectorale]